MGDARSKPGMTVKGRCPVEPGMTTKGRCPVEPGMTGSGAAGLRGQVGGAREKG